MRRLLLPLCLLFSFSLNAQVEKVLAALSKKKVVENEKFLVLSEQLVDKVSYLLIFGDYNYAGSLESEYIVAAYQEESGLKILIRDQALHGLMDGLRKASEIPKQARPKLLLAYGNHLSITDADFKSYKAYLSKKIASKKANSDEKWLHENLKEPSKR